MATPPPIICNYTFSSFSTTYPFRPFNKRIGVNHPQAAFSWIMFVGPSNHRKPLAVGRPGELAELAGVFEVGRFEHARSLTVGARQFDDVDLAKHDVIVDAGRRRQRNGDLVLLRIEV